MKFGHRSLRPWGDFTKCRYPTLDDVFRAREGVIDTSRERTYGMEDWLPTQSKGEAGEILPPRW